jgi:hypothetical protein
MAKQAPAFPFADDEIVVALDSFATYPNIQVHKGARLRASHDAVRRNAGMFVKDGPSDAEMATIYEQRRPPREITQHTPITREEEPLTDEDAVLCIRGVRGVHRDGDSHLGPRPLAVAVGVRLNKRELVVKANPDCFVPIVQDGLTRETSVRALTDNFIYQRNEDGVFIPETDGALRAQFGDFKRFQLWYAGQWISRNHPDVHAHPERFEILR